MHLKKTLMPTIWPTARKAKGKRFVVVMSHSKTKGIPLLYVLRDMLKVANSRKEVKKILYQGEVKVNGIVRKSDSFPMQVFDSIVLDKEDLCYRLVIINRKFQLEKIDKKLSEKKIAKIIGKKVISKDSVQMNLEDGSNILSKEKFEVGDSVIYSLKEKKIIKILPLKKGSKIEVIKGKHAGKKGELIEIKPLNRGREYKVKLEDSFEVILPYKVILVID